MLYTTFDLIADIGDVEVIDRNVTISYNTPCIK